MVFGALGELKLGVVQEEIVADVRAAAVLATAAVRRLERDLIKATLVWLLCCCCCVVRRLVLRRELSLPFVLENSSWHNAPFCRLRGTCGQNDPICGVTAHLGRLRGVHRNLTAFHRGESTNISIGSRGSSL